MRLANVGSEEGVMERWAEGKRWKEIILGEKRRHNGLPQPSSALEL